MAQDGISTHYDAGGIEVLDVLKAKLTPEQYKGWLLGTLLAYGLRLNFKDQAAGDARKMAFYSGLLREVMEDEAAGPAPNKRQVARAIRKALAARRRKSAK